MNAQNLTIQAAIEEQKIDGELAAIIHLPDGRRREVLRDDGHVPGDVPMDGLWTARFIIPTSRVIDFELEQIQDANPSVLFRRMVRLPYEENVELNFYLERKGTHIVASRVAWLPSAGQDEYLGSELFLDLAFGWGVLCMLYVATLVLLSSRKKRRVNRSRTGRTRADQPQTDTAKTDVEQTDTAKTK